MGRMKIQRAEEFLMTDREMIQNKLRHERSEQMKKEIDKEMATMRGIRNYEDQVKDRVESKCMSCKHYCAQGAQAKIKTPTAGWMTWYVSENYCTALGYFPEKMVMPPGINSPIGEIPAVTDCQAYEKGSYLKIKPPTDELATAYDEAEDNFRKTTIQPHIETVQKQAEMESPLYFDKYGKATVPRHVKEIIHISMGPKKFIEDQDFTVNDRTVTWNNPAFTVGPHIRMKIKFTV